MSSEENPISYPSLANEIEELYTTGLLKPDEELDGELWGYDLNEAEVHKAIKADVERLQLYCFDIKTQQPQLRRLRRLSDIFGSELLLSAVEVPWGVVTEQYEIDQHLRSYVNQGYEGIILRHPAAPYEEKRSKYLLKFKPSHEDEYEIIGVEEEHSINGVPKNSLGALICRDADGEAFNVGSGFTHEQREKLWKLNLEGKRAKVRYQLLSKARGVPLHSVFVEVV